MECKNTTGNARVMRCSIQKIGARDSKA